MSQPEDEKRGRIFDDLGDVTSRISETTRFVSFGLIAIYYTLRTSTDGLGAELQNQFPRAVAVVGLCGAVALLLDYLQYWFGNRAGWEALDRPGISYSKRSFWYRARGWTFHIKQGFAVVGALVLIALFAFS